MVKTPETLELEVRAFTPEGDPRGVQNQIVRLTSNPGPPSTFRYEVLTHIDLRPGRYNLRFAVHSLERNSDGSVFADVEVPDLSNAPLSLSGLALEAEPALTSAHDGKLSSLIPVVPTARRDFDAGDRLKAFVRIYQGSGRLLEPIVINTTIVDEAETEVFQHSEYLGPDRFGELRTADVTQEIPVRNLHAGSFHLRIQAKGSKSETKRDVTLRIH